MRPIIILLMIFLFSVILSCSIRNYKLPAKPAIIKMEAPTAPVMEKIAFTPVPVPIQDTVRDTASVIIQSPPVHHIDTSALRSWIYDFAESQRNEWLEEK